MEDDPTGTLGGFLQPPATTPLGKAQLRQREEATEAAQLMARYCGGDAAAFQMIYALLAPRLLGYLFGLLRDRAAAEDALQLAFLKLHEARGTYVAGANPIPWVYTIAHRTALDELRKRKRARVRLTSDGALPAEPAAHVTGVPVEAHQDAADRPSASAARGALAALDGLPENQREALLLTKVHGRSTVEAAMIAGTTPGAIKQRAHRAYLTLRRVLRKDGDSDNEASASDGSAAPLRKETS